MVMVVFNENNYGMFFHNSHAVLNVSPSLYSIVNIYIKI